MDAEAAAGLPDRHARRRMVALVDQEVPVITDLMDQRRDCGGDRAPLLAPPRHVWGEQERRSRPLSDLRVGSGLAAIALDG